MPQGYRRIGVPVPIQGALYRNSALYEDRPHLARLVVGGPAHGQVLVSQQADLVLARPLSPEQIYGGIAPAGRPDEPIITEHQHYSAAEVGVSGRIYRTWMAGSDSPEEHVLAAILAFADTDADRLESCRAA